MRALVVVVVVMLIAPSVSAAIPSPFARMRGAAEFGYYQDKEWKSYEVTKNYAIDLGEVVLNWEDHLECQSFRMTSWSSPD
jgi:hypothetical protein